MAKILVRLVLIMLFSYSVALAQTATTHPATRGAQATALPHRVAAIGQPGVKSPVTLRAIPPSWGGTCPKEFNFVGVITSRGAGEVKYAFERSDGATMAPVTLNFARPNQRQPVKDNWSISKPSNVTYHGWEQIKVISPNVIRSNKATFVLHCKK